MARDRSHKIGSKSTIKVNYKFKPNPRKTSRSDARTLSGALSRHRTNEKPAIWACFVVSSAIAVMMGLTYFAIKLGGVKEFPR